MKPQEKAFWDALEEKQDPINYLALADWFEENDNPDMAMTLRWAQENNKFPRYLCWFHTGVEKEDLDSVLYLGVMSNLNTTPKTHPLKVPFVRLCYALMTTGFLQQKIVDINGVNYRIRNITTHNWIVDKSYPDGTFYNDWHFVDDCDTIEEVIEEIKRVIYGYGYSGS